MHHILIFISHTITLCEKQTEILVLAIVILNLSYGWIFHFELMNMPMICSGEEALYAKLNIK